MVKKIIIVISLFLALAIGWFFLWPQYQELKNVRQEIKNKQEELQMIDNYFLKLEKIKSELAQYSSEDLAKLDSALPTNPGSYLPALFNYLQKSASQYGLVLKEISSAKINSLKERANLSEVVFNIQLVGSYSSLKNWLSQITKSARIIEIEDLSFAYEKVATTEQKKEVSEPSFTFKINLKTFSY
ncbi:MAG: type 4a pilus biogenesis protein PilO [Minisyncoccales bacterium]